MIEFLEPQPDELRELRPRQRTVLRMRFGLEGEKRHTLSEVGRSLGVKPERVRQIQNAALAAICRDRGDRKCTLFASIRMMAGTKDRPRTNHQFARYLASLEKTNPNRWGEGGSAFERMLGAVHVGKDRVAKPAHRSSSA